MPARNPEGIPVVTVPWGDNRQADEREVAFRSPLKNGGTLWLTRYCVLDDKNGIKTVTITCIQHSDNKDADSVTYVLGASTPFGYRVLSTDGEKGDAYNFRVTITPGQADRDHLPTLW